jgi:membrane-associated protease RseP (regulator of RpoE activity)
MLSSEQLPPTRYDLRFSIAGIPVLVHPSFWLFALIFGASGDVLLLPIWILAVFLSIFVHELGHALAFRRYGQRSQIVLHFAGGVTVPEPVRWGGGMANVSLTANQHTFISLAGPGMGFLFAAVVTGIVLGVGGRVAIGWLGFIPLSFSAALPFGGRVLAALIQMLLSVTVFWGLINLMPVYPLDGGNVARNIFIQADPVDGIRKSLWLSMIVGGVIVVFGIVFLHSLFIVLLFGLLALQSYKSLQHRF